MRYDVAGGEGRAARVRFSGFTGLAALLLLTVAAASAAAESGVFVEVRASDAADAPVVERWRL